MPFGIISICSYVNLETINIIFSDVEKKWKLCF